MPQRRRGRSSAEQLDFSTDTGEILAPFVAPFARDVGAVVQDLDDLDIARAVVEACCGADAAGGLTLSDIRSRVDGQVDHDALERRLRVFVGLGMLRPIEDRKGVGRYILDPRALAGIQVAERITSEGSVSELLLLLDRTSAAVRAGTAVREEVAAALERAVLFFRLVGDTLARLTRGAPIAELYAEVRHHENRQLLTNLDQLTRLVAGAFSDLEPRAHAALLEAQRYDRYLGAAADRVIAEAGAARDFGVLSPETWKTAAIHAPWEALTEVASTLVVDAPDPCVSADVLVEAVERWKPRATRNELPPEPDVIPGPDPLALKREERRRRRERLDAQIGSLLQGAETLDITSILRGGSWPSASRLLADVLAADRDRTLPVSASLGDGLLADPVIDVAWCSTPVVVSRKTRQPTDEDRTEGGRQPHTEGSTATP